MPNSALLACCFHLNFPLDYVISPNGKVIFSLLSNLSPTLSVCGIFLTALNNISFQTLFCFQALSLTLPSNSCYLLWQQQPSHFPVYRLRVREEGILFLSNLFLNWLKQNLISSFSGIQFIFKHFFIVNICTKISFWNLILHW